MKLTYVEPTIEVKRYEISDVISTGASGNKPETESSNFQSVDDLVNDTDLSTTVEEPATEEPTVESPAVEESVDPAMGEVSESVDNFIAE